MFRAGCEALKTQGRANPGILPEAGHPPHREATSTVQGDIGPGTGQGATSWKTHGGVDRSSHMLGVWRMLQEPLEEGGSTVPQLPSQVTFL